MLDGLEGNKPKVEGAVQTMDAKPTEPKVETTVITETPEFRQALDKALGKGLASINTQLTLRTQGEKAAKSEAEAAAQEVGRLEKEIKELMQDDPDKLRAYTDRREISRKVAEAEKKLYEAELKEWNANMTAKANELREETGIPLADLAGATTQEEMEVRALRFKLTKPAEVKPAPKLDSGRNDGGSLLPETAKGKIQAGWAKRH